MMALAAVARSQSTEHGAHAGTAQAKLEDATLPIARYRDVPPWELHAWQGGSVGASELGGSTSPSPDRALTVPLLARQKQENTFCRAKHLLPQQACTNKLKH